MIEYDSEYSIALPFVPFIIETPTLCYIVDVHLSLVEQNVHLHYFDMVQTDITPKNATDRQIKDIGLRCVDFLFFCSKYHLVGNGYTLIVEPYELGIERVEAINNPFLSLDVIPATGDEAWAFYMLSRIKYKQNIVDGVTEDLNHDRISLSQVRKLHPTLIKEHERSKRKNMETGIDFTGFEQAVLRHGLKDPVINEKNREIVSGFNLSVYSLFPNVLY